MNYIFDPSLVLYLPLHQADGASFMSRDAYGHLCTVTGASWRPQGRKFDGVDDIITIGASTDAELYPETFSWELWLNIDDTGENEAILGTGQESALREKPWEILAQGADNSISGAIRQSDLTIKNAAFTDLIVQGAGWVHFVFTGDGSITRGYLNAVMSSATGSYDGTLDQANRVENVLGKARGTWLLNGSIGEVRLYNRALTPQEIQRNYLATKWRYR